MVVRRLPRRGGIGRMPNLIVGVNRGGGVGVLEVGLLAGRWDTPFLKPLQEKKSVCEHKDTAPLLSQSAKQ